MWVSTYFFLCVCPVWYKTEGFSRLTNDVDDSDDGDDDGQLLRAALIFVHHMDKYEQSLIWYRDNDSNCFTRWNYEYVLIRWDTPT